MYCSSKHRKYKHTKDKVSVARFAGCLLKYPTKPTPRIAAAASMATSLTFALLPSQGLRGSIRSFPFTKPQRQFSRKAGSNLITARFELKPPPYPLNALEPLMSQETFAYHWGKHHRAYVENLNKQIVGTELEGLSLEDIITVSYNNGDILPAFNNAAQAWNHEFFWESMKPGGGGKPSGDLLDLIERDFGSFERFIEEFKSAAATQFGSGWAWLAYKANRLDVENAVNPWPSEKDKKLVVVKSPNAVNPLVWDYFVSIFLATHIVLHVTTVDVQFDFC
ncbi:hypothetical protein CRYUN_Cryun12cG0184900 [Craigia yunnanensis]